MRLTHQKEAITLAPLQLGLWHPKISSCVKCAHTDAAQRFECPCAQAHWGRAIQASGEPWQIVSSAALRVRYKKRGADRTFIMGSADQDPCTWGAQPKRPQPAVAVWELAAAVSWAAVVRSFARGM